MGFIPPLFCFLVCELESASIKISEDQSEGLSEGENRQKMTTSFDFSGFSGLSFFSLFCVWTLGTWCLLVTQFTPERVGGWGWRPCLELRPRDNAVVTLWPSEQARVTKSHSSQSVSDPFDPFLRGQILTTILSPSGSFDSSARWVVR